MPALPPVAKVVRVDFHFTTPGTPNLQIRNFFRYGGTLSVTDAVTWLAAIQTAFAANVLPPLSNSLTLGTVELTDLSSTTAAQVLNSTGGTGGSSSPVNPAGVAMIVKHKLIRRYRGGHPRVYIPGTLQGWLLSPSTWQSGPLGTVVAAYIAYINAATTTPGGTAIGVITHVNVSYFQGFTNTESSSGRAFAKPTPRATPLVDAVDNYSGNNHVASQRRRNQQP